MSEYLDDHVPLAVAKTTLSHVVRLGLRVYVASVVIVGVYSLLWLAELAGLVSVTLLSTIWVAIAVMGTLFLALLIPLFYVSRSTL